MYTLLHIRQQRFLASKLFVQLNILIFFYSATGTDFFLNSRQTSKRFILSVEREKEGEAGAECLFLALLTVSYMQTGNDLIMFIIAALGHSITFTGTKNICIQ